MSKSSEPGRSRNPGRFLYSYERFVSAWFSWLGWLLVTAAIYAASKATNSILLLIVSAISGLLVLGYSILRIASLTKFYARPFSVGNDPNLGCFAAYITLLVAGFQLILIAAAFRIVNTMFAPNAPM